MKVVGNLGEIIRHPVKALRGESLAHCVVDAFGLYGDRAHYFGDGRREGVQISMKLFSLFTLHTLVQVGQIRTRRW